MKYVEYEMSAVATTLSLLVIAIRIVETMIARRIQNMRGYLEVTIHVGSW
jgi:hypothetical protein